MWRGPARLTGFEAIPLWPVGEGAVLFGGCRVGGSGSTSRAGCLGLASRARRGIRHRRPRCRVRPGAGAGRGRGRAASSRRARSACPGRRPGRGPCTTMWSLSTTVDRRCAITMSVRSGRDGVDRVAHALLVEAVERRGRLVEQQDRGCGQQRPGDREALALAAREHDAALADRGVDAERVALEHLAEVHGAQHALAVVIGCLGRGQSQVLGDRPGEGRGILLDVAELRAQRVAVEGARCRRRRAGSRRRSGRRSAR